MNVLVTGGAGYVGSALVPRLLAAGHRVAVLDRYLYDAHALAPWRGASLFEVHGDIRDRMAVQNALAGCAAVIHLACLSNDPACELKPGLAKAVDYEGFLVVLEEARRAKVKRFVYASSSSVYGTRTEEEVTEGLVPVPLTDYARHKVWCEDALFANPGEMVVVAARPATLYGPAPRLRLDTVVNWFTAQAFFEGGITVRGGSQFRALLHVEDMADFYVRLLEAPPADVHGHAFNASYANYTVAAIAESVCRSVPSKIVYKRADNDLRSYRLCSKKAWRVLGFHPARSVEEGIRSLLAGFICGCAPSAMTDSHYHNLKRIQELDIC